MHYVAIDLETTGLDYMNDHVIEIAAIKLDEYFNEVGTFHTLVNPGDIDVPAFITELTGLTNMDLEYGITPEDAWEMLDVFIGDATVIAQHAPFDLSFLCKNGINPNHFICTRSLTMLVEPDENPSLIPTCERLGIELDEAHRALYDIRATIKVFREQIVTLINQDEMLDVLLVSSNRPLNFIPASTESIRTNKDGIIAVFK